MTTEQASYGPAKKVVAPSPTVSITPVVDQERDEGEPEAHRHYDAVCGYRRRRHLQTFTIAALNHITS
jgi:hypothetical protein